MSKGFNFTSIINALNTAGQSGLIPSVLSNIAGNNSVSTKIDALLNQLVQDAASPAAASNIVTQIEATPGCPAGVVSALESIRAGGFQQLAIIEAIPGIEAAVNAANPTEAFFKQMNIDTATFAAAAAVADIVATVGGGFYFMGKMTGRLDAQDVSLATVKKDVGDLKAVVVSAAVHQNRIERAENDIQAIEADLRNLRAGSGWIQDRGAKTVDREY